MDEITQDDFRQSNHMFILEFMAKLAHLEDELGESMKATIAQFIHDVRRDIRLIANSHDGMICEQDIYDTQIRSLRQCIIDLQGCLQRSLTRSKPQ